MTRSLLISYSSVFIIMLLHSKETNAGVSRYNAYTTAPKTVFWYHLTQPPIVNTTKALPCSVASKFEYSCLDTTNTTTLVPSNNSQISAKQNIVKKISSTTITLKSENTLASTTTRKLAPIEERIINRITAAEQTIDSKLLLHLQPGLGTNKTHFLTSLTIAKILPCSIASRITDHCVDTTNKTTPAVPLNISPITVKQSTVKNIPPTATATEIFTQTSTMKSMITNRITTNVDQAGVSKMLTHFRFTLSTNMVHFLTTFTTTKFPVFFKKLRKKKKRTVLVRLLNYEDRAATEKPAVTTPRLTFVVNYPEVKNAKGKHVLPKRYRANTVKICTNSNHLV